MYFYKDNRRVVIHFADADRVRKFKDALGSSVTDMVDVIYNPGTIKFRMAIPTDISLANSGGFIRTGKKKYLWDLIYSWDRSMLDKITFRSNTYLRLYQRAKKKYLGGWHDYSTDYSIRNINVGIKGCGINKNIWGGEQSINRSKGANYTFFHLQTPMPGSIGILPDGHAKIEVSVKANHKSSYLGWPGFDLNYNGEIGNAELYMAIKDKLHY